MVALGFTVYIGASRTMPSNDILPLHVHCKNHTTVYLSFFLPSLVLWLPSVSYTPQYIVPIVTFDILF